jgi:Tfp pilus assembly protein PilF
MSRRGAAPFAVLLSMLLALAAPTVSCAEPPADLQRWQTTLQRYVANPTANAGALLALGRAGTDGLPPLFRVALADAHLRAGDLRTAGRLFDDILASDPGEPWRGFAALGLGWTAARRGDLEAARDAFLDASTAPGETGLLGNLLAGMIEAADGAGAEASERFAHIIDDPGASENLRVAALMGDGYSRFWMGDDAGARVAFARVTEQSPDGLLADDARYAAALTQWRQGDRTGAEEALSALAAETSRRHDRSSAGVTNLDPRSLFRAGARRYRRLPLGVPSDQLLGTLDLDAPSIARVALRRLRAGGSPPTPVRLSRPDAADDAAADSRRRPIADSTVHGDSGVERWQASSYLWAGVAVALLMAALWLWLQRSSRPYSVR